MLNLKASGVIDGTARFLQQNQLKDSALWKKFVEVFVSQPDAGSYAGAGKDRQTVIAVRLKTK